MRMWGVQKIDIRIRFALMFLVLLRILRPSFVGLFDCVEFHMGIMKETSDPVGNAK